MHNKEHENFDCEAVLNELLDYIGPFPKPAAKLLDIDRYRQLMAAAANLQKMLSGAVPDGCLTTDIDRNFNLGSISVELPELFAPDPQTFSDILKDADNFEIYPLANGNLRLDITFQRMLKSIY